MSEFTYVIPESRAFLHTLRVYLEATKHGDIATTLIGATCIISADGSWAGVGWNVRSATVTFRVPAPNVPKFTDRVKRTLFEAADTVFPVESGYAITCQVAPVIESPAEVDEPLANTATLGTIGPIEHDGLRFRSWSETRIYDSLKNQNVLFFANATGVLGGKNTKREPDFLICLDGKWGVLEVMGEHYHPSATRDHERARLFKDYGLSFIEFYDASRCYSKPQEVVDDFLKRLAKS